MTARDPTPPLELKLAREKAGDFEWAFNGWWTSWSSG